MNALFEEYIGRLVTRALAGSEFRVTLQGGRLFCLTSVDDERADLVDRIRGRILTGIDEMSAAEP
ncbi:hypothetical protein [Pseudotabrizicola alkalilacus]|uniref:hypothetical protein n=1 Tax=Pseudotabrizicola alkalilacus TaxID=2305252 RepID=UPI0018F1FF07|nr:hypothetical protein [Pseudotabrizicola alkalilacus]